MITEVVCDEVQVFHTHHCGRHRLRAVPPCTKLYDNLGIVRDPPAEVAPQKVFAMSGHSKWSSIKHKKAITDSKRGRVFTKMIKEITIAARLGGGDINSNPRLRTAVTVAKKQSMPNDNIDRAIKKGTGEIAGASLEEITYEGYGPGGVAIMVDVLSDNRNRTVAELRFVFSRHGGNLGEVGCVGWMFKKRGVIGIEKSAIDEDKLLELALDAGADDLTSDGDTFQVLTSPDKFSTVRDALEKADIPIAHSEQTRIPENTVAVSGHTAGQVLKLMKSSRITTTCRTSPPTSTSATRRWRSSRRPDAARFCRGGGVCGYSGWIPGVRYAVTDRRRGAGPTLCDRRHDSMRVAGARSRAFATHP